MSKMKIQERTGRNLTFMQVQAILALYRRGYSVVEVADFFNVHKMTVYHRFCFFKKHGVMPTPKPIAVALAEEGYS